MKYSLIIVAYKAPEALARCLASLEENPPPDSQREAEIVIVDNSPEAVEVKNAILHSLLLKYVRVIIVRDGTNRGFAEGCNEGVRHSHGKTLVFINPDTRVFPGWCERMEAHLTAGDGKVGAVGPLSNFVAGHQHFIHHMHPPDTWEAVAEVCGRALKGRGVETKLLIGFFLMVRRGVWEQMGGLDPVFFLGCDDLDFSLRLREAGYTLVIASDVFVFHEGHVSFQAMGDKESTTLNKRAEKALMAKLHAKYGPDLPTSTELWGCEILPTDTMKRMTLSVCMIVRDEKENLRQLLPQLGFADEIVIVNTAPKGGSVLDPDFEYDPPTKTPPPIRLYDYTDSSDPETGELRDFSAARNYALARCSSNWVLWLDADDRMPQESAALIRAALDFPGPLTARRICHFALRLRDHLPTGNVGYCHQPRLFPNIPGMAWDGAIHENYLAAADALGLKLVTTDILLDHHGYEDAERLRQKHERNLRILLASPNSPLKFYHMGKCEMGLRRFQAARNTFRFCLNNEWAGPLAPDFIAQVKYLCALSYYQELGTAAPPMDSFLDGNPKPDALFLRAERALAAGDLDEAEEMFRLYASYGPIMEYYGTDQDTFQPCAVLRLAQIQQVRATLALQSHA